MKGVIKVNPHPTPQHGLEFSWFWEAGFLLLLLLLVKIRTHTHMYIPMHPSGFNFIDVAIGVTYRHFLKWVGALGDSACISWQEWRGHAHFLQQLTYLVVYLILQIKRYEDIWMRRVGELIISLNCYYYYVNSFLSFKELSLKRFHMVHRSRSVYIIDKLYTLCI